MAYEDDKTAVLAAKKTLDELETHVTQEAKRRGDAYILHAQHYGRQVEWAYLTLDDAVDCAQDDCAPDVIIGPDGTRYNPYSGDKEEN